MLIGYARVSTQDQNLELQREALTKAGCQKVFEDKVSGTRAKRPGLDKALEMVRSGDVLVVWKLDRLGRSVKQLVDLVAELHGLALHIGEHRILLQRRQHLAGQQRAAHRPKTPHRHGGAHPGGADGRGI